jgi:hypothetical protein
MPPDFPLILSAILTCLGLVGPIEIWKISKSLLQSSTMSMYRCQLFKKTVCAKQNDSENSKKATVEKSTTDSEWVNGRWHWRLHPFGLPRFSLLGGGDSCDLDPI